MKRQAKTKKTNIKYNGDTLYVFPAGRLPSKKRIEFTPGGILPVLGKDVEEILKTNLFEKES